MILGDFVCEIVILVTRVNDFKFFVNLGLRISNFANLSISQNSKFSQIWNFVQKKFNIAIVLWVLGRDTENDAHKTSSNENNNQNDGKAAKDAAPKGRRPERNNNCFHIFWYDFGFWQIIVFINF